MQALGRVDGAGVQSVVEGDQSLFHEDAQTLVDVQGGACQTAGGRQMGAAVGVDDDLVAAEQVLAAHGRTLGHQGVGDHDGVVRPLAHEVVVQGSGGGVAAVTDDLAVHGADAVSGAHQTVCTVVEGRHTVINVGHGACAVGVGHDSLLVGRAAVADADHHAVGRQVAGEGEVLVMLRCQRDIADVAPGRFLVVLELLDGGFDDVLVRLCALVLHVEIGAFEVDAQDLCAVVAALHDIGHVGDSVGQHLHALGDGGGEEAGDALRDDVLCPVAQAVLVGVVGVELVGAVAVDVHKAGDDALVTVIVVHILGAIGQDGGDPAVIHLNSSRDELVCQPDLFALYYHFRCPPSGIDNLISLYRTDSEKYL